MNRRQFEMLREKYRPLGENYFSDDEQTFEAVEVKIPVLIKIPLGPPGKLPDLGTLVKKYGESAVFGMAKETLVRGIAQEKKRQLEYDMIKVF